MLQVTERLAMPSGSAAEVPGYHELPAGEVPTIVCVDRRPFVDPDKHIYFPNNDAYAPGMVDLDYTIGIPGGLLGVNHVDNVTRVMAAHTLGENHHLSRWTENNRHHTENALRLSEDLRAAGYQSTIHSDITTERGGRFRRHDNEIAGVGCKWALFHLVVLDMLDNNEVLAAGEELFSASYGPDNVGYYHEAVRAAKEVKRHTSSRANPYGRQLFKSLAHNGIPVVMHEADLVHSDNHAEEPLVMHISASTEAVSTPGSGFYRLDVGHMGMAVMRARHSRSPEKQPSKLSPEQQVLSYLGAVTVDGICTFGVLAKDNDGRVNLDSANVVRIGSSTKMVDDLIELAAA